MALTTNLVAYYKFDETSGTVAADATGLGHTANLVGTLGSQWAAGKINNGAVFNGTDNYFTSPSTADLQIVGAFTLQAWVKIADYTNFYGMMAKYTDDTHMEFQTRVDQTTGVARIYISNDNMASTGTIPFNTFTHVVFTHASATGDIICYLNGTVDSTGLSKAGGTATAAPLIIGNRSAGGFDPYKGTIDEVGIWSRALAGTEVSALYNSGAGLQYPFTTSTYTPKNLTLMGVG